MRLDLFMQFVKPLGWLVERLIPLSTKVLLVARAGTGKSWWVEELMIAVAAGRPAFGHFAVPRAGPVLLIDQDTPTTVLTERLAAFPGFCDDLPIRIASHEGLALDKPEGATRIQTLVKVEQPSLIVIETLETVTSSDFNENRAQDVTRLFDNLNAIHKENPEAAIILTHHFGKRGQAGEPDTWIRGSSVLPARVDVGFSIQRLPGQSGRQRSFWLLPFPKRVLTTNPFEFRLLTTEVDGRLDTATLSWVKEVDPDVDPKLIAARESVLELVRDSGVDGLTVREALNGSGGYLGDPQLREILHGLERDGSIIRGTETKGRFRYWTPEHLPENQRSKK